LNSRERTLGVELSTTIDAAIRRLTPYLAGANERDAYNEVILAARQMADVLSPMLAAGALKGKAAKEAANGINRLNLARYNLECIFGENKVLVPGHPSWQAMAAKQSEATGVKEPGVKEPGIEERGIPELEAEEPSSREAGK
jgi:hypothetical protein